MQTAVIFLLTKVRWDQSIHLRSASERRWMFEAAREAMGCCGITDSLEVLAWFELSPSPRQSPSIAPYVNATWSGQFCSDQS